MSAEATNEFFKTIRYFIKTYINPDYSDSLQIYKIDFKLPRYEKKCWQEGCHHNTLFIVPPTFPKLHLFDQSNMKFFNECLGASVSLNGALTLTLEGVSAAGGGGADGSSSGGGGGGGGGADGAAVPAMMGSSSGGGGGVWAGAPGGGGGRRVTFDEGRAFHSIHSANLMHTEREAVDRHGVTLNIKYMVTEWSGGLRARNTDYRYDVELCTEINSEDIVAITQQEYTRIRAGVPDPLTPSIKPPLPQTSKEKEMFAKWDREADRGVMVARMKAHFPKRYSEAEDASLEWNRGTLKSQRENIKRKLADIGDNVTKLCYIQEELDEQKAYIKRIEKKIDTLFRRRLINALESRKRLKKSKKPKLTFEPNLEQVIELNGTRLAAYLAQPGEKHAQESFKKQVREQEVRREKEELQKARKLLIFLHRHQAATAKKEAVAAAVDAADAAALRSSGAAAAVKAAAKAAAAEAAAEAAAAVAQDTAGGVRADVTSSGQRTGKYFPLQSHSMLPRRQRVEPPLRRAQAQGPYDGYGFDFDFEDDEYAAAFTGGFEDDLGRFYPHGPDGGFTGRYAMGSYCPPIDDDSIPLEDEGGNPLPAAERAALRHAAIVEAAALRSPGAVVEAAAAVAQDAAGGVRAEVTSSGQRTGVYFPLQPHPTFPRRQQREPPLRRVYAQRPGDFSGYGYDYDQCYYGGFEDDLGRFYPDGPHGGGFTGHYAMGSYCPPVDDDSIPLEDEGGNPLPAAERAALRARKAEVKRIKDEATAASGGSESGGGGGGGGGAAASSAASYMYIRL